MSENNSGGLWRDLQWKLIGGSVAIILVLQLIAYYAIHYPIIQSLSLTVLLVSYIIIPRAQARKFTNAVVGVIAVWVVGVILEITLEHAWTTGPKGNQLMSYVELTVIPLLLGIAVAYGYMRLTNWSARKRVENDAKRKVQSAPSSTPARRVHSKKKRKKK